MSTYLDEIVAAHRRRSTADPRAVGPLLESAHQAPATRPFQAALRRDSISVIAEIKRRSPSRGPLAETLEPAVVAKDYEAGGASALSVLTDQPHFGGSPDDLVAARASVTLPVLRKDFTVDLRDVLDARIMGADAILLIAAVLDDEQLRTFRSMADELSMAALVEVHDETELNRALDTGASVIGVNQRDLHTFEVDHDRARSLAALIPSDVVAIAESGVKSPLDAQSLAEVGFDAILVGESVVTASDRQSQVASLCGFATTRRPGRQR